MLINLRENCHVEGDDGSCGFCCRIEIYILVERMESGVDALHDF
jgi:hypothetical protein